MRQEDIEEVGDLWKNIYKSEHPSLPNEELISLHDSMIKELLPKAIADSSGYVFEAGGEIIGFITMTTLSRKPYIDNIYVSPEHRRKGVGTELIKKAQELHDSLGLHVFQDKSASIIFYEKCGFKHICDKVGEKRDKIFMEWFRTN